MTKMAGVCFMAMVLLSCLPDSKQSFDWPAADQIKVSWELLDQAMEGDDRRKAAFEIANESDTVMSGFGWSLYYSQFPHSLYFDSGTEDLFSIENAGGDLYRLTPGDSFPSITPGERIRLPYMLAARLVKQSHGPHGVYFTFDEHLNRPSQEAAFEIKDFPLDLAFDTEKEEVAMRISAQERYEENAQLRSLPTGVSERITPTPLLLRDKGRLHTIGSSVVVGFEPGLERQADYLATELNRMLRATVQLSDEQVTTEDVIYLRLDSLGIGDRTSENYTLDIDPSVGVVITGSDPAGVFYGIQTLRALVPPTSHRVPSEELVVPALYIEDAPRFGYRGLHYDIARNYLGIESIKKVIDLASFYKLNKLHLHLTDDEGWRLEIPGIPELTSVGAVRGPGPDQLPPAYGSGTGADPGNGYLSRDQFIGLLRYATERHMEVIPEINGPGHARAAIVAMDHRYKRLAAQGRASEARAYLLHDRNDTSRYTSAQNYHDNVICVCQEFTYTFLDKVIAEVVAMYKEAEAPLTMIHTGGDEVPAGAWEGSPECQRLIRDNEDLSSVADLHPYFLERYNEIAQKHGLRIGGWEEIVLLRDEITGRTAPNPKYVSERFVPYVWNTAIGGGHEDMAYRMANAGYEVVMCNASNLYFDFAYNREPDEPGLFWGGYVNTKNAFELTPFNILMTVFADDEGNPVDGLALAKQKVPLLPEAEGNILGVQGQLWSETLKDPAMVEYYLLPKMLGLVERAWSRAPSWSRSTGSDAIASALERDWEKFANRIGKVELPRLDYLEGGFFYRIPPPGAVVRDGRLLANTAFPGLQIRYTTDGTDPTPFSDLYQTPVDVEAGQIIKLRVFNTDNRASRMTEVEVFQREPN